MGPADRVLMWLKTGWVSLELNELRRTQNVPNQKINMARKKNRSNGTTDNNDPHFPPERVVRLLVGIKSTISFAESRVVGFEDLEQLSGRPAGTIGSWFEGARMNQLEFLFSLLERVPPGLRHGLLDAIYRMQPTLKDPKLAHDPVALTRLETLLMQRAGFTVIHGGPRHARSFLLNALGNSTREINCGQQSVVGVELQHVSVWAPVPGIIHLSPHAEIRQQFERAWAKIKQADDGSLIMLGHIWNRVSHLHTEIEQLAQRCHVLVADEFLKPEDLVRRIPGPVHKISVALAREQPEWIRVSIQGG